MIENIRQSLRGIWHHKMRSFLTMLGVIIGIASILVITSIIDGTGKKLQKSLVGSGTNAVMVEACKNEQPYVDQTDGNNMPLGFPPVTDDTLKEIRKMDSVVGASRFYGRQYSAQACVGNNQLMGFNLYGVEPDFFDTVGYRLKEGRMMTNEEANEAKKVAVLDSKVALDLFGSSPAVGKVAEIQGEPYKVIGVVESNSEKKENYSTYEEYLASQHSMGNIFVTYGSWPVIYTFSEPAGVAVRTAEPKNMPSVGKKVAEFLNMSVTNGSVSYEAVNSDETAKMLKKITSAITALLVSIASLSLLVGGIGVMNIMLVSVSERTPEIGLKKALGAKKRVILGQFLTESAVITSVGGIIGVIIGLIIGRVLSYLLSMEFAVSLLWILIATVFSIVIGLIFGVMPARKAANMNPIDALRRE